MVDIHSHILPEQDDGARSFEIALQMVRMAAAAGTTDIVASPHCNGEFKFVPEEVKAKIANLQAAVGPVPAIHYGCDFHLTPENVEAAIAEPGKYSINHRGYILVEFADSMIPRNMEGIFSRLLSAGLLPIITHPERNPILQKRLNELSSWVQGGCYIQVTAQSLSGRFGKTARTISAQLIERGLVHFLASDAHDCQHRPPLLDEIWSYVSRSYGDAAARRLLKENPRAAIYGEEITLDSLDLKRQTWFSRLFPK